MSYVVKLANSPLTESYDNTLIKLATWQYTNIPVPPLAT